MTTSITTYRVPETKNDRAARLLRERRLNVLFVERDALVFAEMRGDSGAVHTLGWRPDQKRWGCTCEANAKFKRECAHLVALKMIVVRP